MLKYIVISSGEAAGTAAEIIIKTVHEKPFGAFGGIIVTGDLGVYQKTAKDLGIALPFSAFVSSEDELKKAEEKEEQYIFFSTSNIDISKFEYGKVSKETGIASYNALRIANRIICNRLASTLVTTKVSSKALELAGYKERSLFELLGAFASSARLCDMLVAEKANIFLLSDRVSIKQAMEKISIENIIDALIQKEGLFVSDYFDERLPIAVSALNPQDSNGLWCGEEEEKIIEPAIATAKRIGMNVIGPVPVDRIYKNALQGEYSAVLVFMRNEAYAALSRENHVVITWGLPYMRVGSTVDISLDIAGKNMADIANMKKTLGIAIKISDKGVFA